IKHVENYVIENGFEVVKRRTQKNKGSDIIYRTLEYKHSGEHKAKKKADTEENREHEIESYNSLIKRSVKTSTTLYKLDVQIQLQLDREEQFEYNDQINQNLTVGLPNIIDRYFSQINVSLKNYLTPRDQITKNQVHYKPIKVANDIEFAEDSYESVITNLDSLIK
ncbi:9054_t:CDS:2, partial [Racocetra fulgida]